MSEKFAAHAPGRVNLIGEHTDYNGGMVLPAALSVGLEVSLVPRRDRRVNVRSSGHPDTALRSLGEEANGHWSDPSVGALRQAGSFGLLEGGADIEIHSTLPAGSGLSSSAALIVAILKAAREAGSGSQSDVGLALGARQVENDYMGVPCGIMDQMAVALATPGTAMALDTKLLKYELVPLPSSHEFVVIHSGLTRKLSDGRYKERKLECDRAKAYFETEDLCLLEPDEIVSSDLAEPFRRRALHCATEHRRVLAAVGALQSNDTTALGALMSESHASMRDLFEVSLPEIDTLVDDACALGAEGARLTGGGFGGCIVACVLKNRSQTWLAELLHRHPQARFIDAVSA